MKEVEHFDDEPMVAAEQAAHHGTEDIVEEMEADDIQGQQVGNQDEQGSSD